MKRNVSKTIAAITLVTALLAPNAVYAEKPVKQTVASDENEYWDSSEVQYLAQVEANYRSTHPEATDEEVADYLKSIIHQSVIDSQQKKKDSKYQGLYTYLLDAELSAVEQKLYDENPSVGDDCLYEGYVAKSAAESSGLDGAHNGKQDAFRHAYWNALMLDEVGRYWAERWGTAHEDGATSQPQIERTMDLSNNERGRQAAEDVINVNWIVTDAELKNQVMWYLNNGKLVYIKNGVLVSSNT